MKTTNFFNYMLHSFLILLLTATVSCTWDYDWDWFGPNGDNSGETVNFQQLSIANNFQFRSGIHSIIVNNSIYQIAYNDNDLYFNNTGSITNFNRTALGDKTVIPPIKSPATISTYYDQDHNLRLLFMNTSNTIYSCGNFNNTDITCIVNSDLPNLPSPPSIITGNNSYQYATPSTQPTAIYLSNGKNEYNQIDNPKDITQPSLTGFTNLTTDISGNLYALVTYGGNTSNPLTFLYRYQPMSNNWYKVLNSANILQPQQKFSANSQGIIFFIHPNNQNITCNNGKEKIPLGYTKNGNTQIGYAVINNNCSVVIDVNEINIDNTDNIYLTLANGNSYYGKINT